MSVASLSRFTVPLASDQSSATQGMLMPKLKYRFRISFENFGVDKQTTELTKQVAEAARPQVSFEDKTIEVYNSKIHYAGKPTWQKMQIKLRDDVTNAVTKLVGQQVQKQFDFFEQASASAAGDYKFTMRIEMLDGSNGQDGDSKSSIETWVLYGCYIQETNFEALQYSSADAMLITLGIQYDNAQQTTAGLTFGAQGFTQPRGRSSGDAATGGGRETSAQF
jgi:hypothetical protein